MSCCGMRPLGESGINPRGILTPNHVALVNKVYPMEAGETGPRPSHLSTLVFYANQKPIKLAKVGECLVKRIEGDLSRAKSGHVSVGLQICDTLMLQCPPTHVNIMAKSILRIVDTVVQSPDPDLMLEATRTFVTFNSLYTHDTIIDVELTEQYSKLVFKFCAQCTYSSTDGIVQQKIHLSGLRAIQSIVASDTFFLNPRAAVYTAKIIPAILSNLHEERRLISTSPPPQKGGAPLPTAPMQSTLTDDLFSKPLQQQSAFASLGALLANGNAKTLRIALDPLWAYMDANDEWRDDAHVAFLMDTIAAAVAPQHHYILLGSLLERVKAPALGPLNRRGVVVGLAVLVGGGNSSGVAVVELLEALVGEIREASARKEEGSIALQGALVEAVGALAIHVVYPTQLSDLVGFIVNRLVKEDAVTCRKLLLRCLIYILTVRRAVLGPMESLANLAEEAPHSRLDAAYFEVDRLDGLTLAALRDYQHVRTKRTSLAFPAARISPSLLIPTLDLLLDTDQDVRILEAMFLAAAFALDVAQRESKANLEDAELVASLYPKLYAYVFGAGNGPVDIVAVGCVVAVLVRRFGTGAVGVGMSLQFAFQLQADIESNTNASQNTRVAVSSLVRDHLADLATAYKIRGLTASISPLPESPFPNTTRLDIFHASVVAHVLGKPSDTILVVPRQFPAKVVILPTEESLQKAAVLPLLWQNSFLNTPSVRDTVEAAFTADAPPHAPPTMSKTNSFTPGRAPTPSGNEFLKPGRLVGSGESSRSAVIPAGAANGSLQSRADTPIKFEDLKDAISVHSGAEGKANGDGGEGSVRSTSASVKIGDKVDVKKLLSGISMTVANMSPKKFLEPGTGLGGRVQMTSREKSGPSVVAHDDQMSIEASARGRGSAFITN
ncbi:hypothetical protein BC830DRAFT_410472 [Chytriomyces sp. MP71]|nr:hypothetical protein BC830DRAFT_410472 [Chytriomyces sp. MP71]